MREIVRLRDQMMLPPVAPDRRQQPVGDHIGQRAISKDVIGGRALAVSEAAAAQEGEGRVDLAGHQQEDEERAEAATADGPLLQVHVLAAACAQAQEQGEGGDQEDDDQFAVHWSAPVLRFAGSQAEMIPITMALMISHSTIQARTSGMPSTRGSTWLKNATPTMRPRNGRMASHRIADTAAPPSRFPVTHAAQS